MKEKYDDSVKDWWPLKNGNLIVTLEDAASVDDGDVAKSIIQMPCHLGSYILGHSKRTMKNVIRERDGFYSNNIYYGDTDTAYIDKNTGLRWLIMDLLVNLPDSVKTIMVTQAYSMLGSLLRK